MILSQPSPSSGCAVLLEPRSGWPQRAFQASADCDRVVVAHLDPQEDNSQLLARLRTHCEDFERSGTKLRSVILACSVMDDDWQYQRAELVRRIVPLLDPERGKMVLESSGEGRLTTQELVASVGDVVADLNGRTIAFLGMDEDMASQVSNRRPSFADDYHELPLDEVG